MNLRKEKPKGLVQKFRAVTRKSRAGVKYTHYVPFIEGKRDTGFNRAMRRKIDKMDRTLPQREKKVRIERAYDDAKKAKRERIAAKYPQRPYLCKQRDCEKRNRKGGFCNEHQGYV